MEIIELETSRTRLRQWKKESDFLPFSQLNADTEVMRYFPKPLSAEESDQLAQRLSGLIETKGWGFWAMELKETREFAGFVGLHTPPSSLPFSPTVEIGWRLAKKHWGHGYATEAATQALHFAFNKLQLEEVVSYTPVCNSRSRKVMERLGLNDTTKNFTHPVVDENSALSKHVLYKITKQDWLDSRRLEHD